MWDVFLSHQFSGTEDFLNFWVALKLISSHLLNAACKLSLITVSQEESLWEMSAVLHLA